MVICFQLMQMALEMEQLFTFITARTNTLRAILLMFGVMKRLGEGSVFHVSAENMKEGKVFTLQTPSLHSGTGMEITTLDGNSLSTNGTLLRVAGNRQTGGLLTSLQGYNIEDGTILDISNNKKLTTGKLVHIHTSSPSSINPVLIEGEEILDGNLMVIKAKKLIHGSL